MTITLTGNNSFLINSRLRKLAQEFVADHGELALERIDGEESDYDRIIGAVESLPFLASKKMVVASNLSANKQATESLEQIVNLAGDTTDLVIVEAKPDKRSTYYKQLKKLTDFNEFNEMDENSLAGWLVEESAGKGGSISKNDALYLVQRVGANQMRLSREIEKLVLYRSEISRETIELLTDESPSGTIFGLVDSIFSGNLERALRIYDEQRKLRVEPQAIHGMLVWQMHAVSVVSAAPSGHSAAQIAKDSGMSPFVVQKSQRIAGKMGRAKIIEFLDILRDIDYRGKHKTMDFDEALRYAIVSLAN